MNQLTRAVRYVAVGSLLLPGLGMLFLLARAVADQLGTLLGIPAAAAILMLALLCAVLGLTNGWMSSPSRDQEI
ncbi:hypothetical protein [Geminicoccus roseus]|uniref:hypothetical protein n=1 Tax=Geminicoccus roseus TaxID=404900 RepID=UPI00041133C4|nr:hypothetical protein [Geminicoccus roseus]